VNKQKLALAILLCLFGVALMYGYLRTPRQKTVNELTYKPGMTAKALRAGKPQAPLRNDQNVESLAIARVALVSSAVHKNIFQPIFIEESSTPPLPLPPPPPPPPKQAQPAPPAPPVVTPPPAPPVDPVARDIARFTFLGFLKKDNKKTIFLSSDKEIYLVKKGDKIAGKYDVTNVTDEALTINVASSGNEIVIPLVENRALSAPNR
jgi:hypothetical protein